MFRSLISVLLVALALTAGCASGGHHSSPPPAPAPAPSPTASMERALADIRVVQPVDCAIAFQVDDSTGSMWSQYNLNGSPGLPGPGCTGLIRADSWILGQPYDEIRALLAHEVSHLLNGDDTPGTIAAKNAGTVSQIDIEKAADLRGAAILKRISTDACMALPRLFSKFRADASHPDPSDRAAYTTAVCQS